MDVTIPRVSEESEASDTILSDHDLRPDMTGARIPIAAANNIRPGKNQRLWGLFFLLVT